MSRSDPEANTPTSGRTPPAISADTQFFWDAAAKEELRIQCCSACGRLRHPQAGLPALPLAGVGDEADERARHALQLHGLASSAAGGFDQPAIVVVVELEEGVRLVSNIAGATAESLRIGEPLEVFFLPQAEGWTAPQFRRPC